jgi:rhodanese-related sulfurtransferase
MRKLKFLLLFSFFGSINLLKSQNPWGFEAMVRSMLEEKVDTVGSDFIHENLNNANLVLLDARSEEEWEVSHLKGARRIGYDPYDPEVLKTVSKEATVVVYCSIGKRSEEVAAELKKMGYSDVKNLFGGIFDWTNRGYTVVNTQGTPVKQVHPYNALWGIWVNNYEKVDGSK